MKVVDSTSEIALRPEHAIVLYGNDNHLRNAHAYATAHTLTHDKSGWQMGAGVPLGRDLVTRALYALLGAGQIEVLPPHVLSVGPGYLAWWSPPQRRAVFFGKASAIGERHGLVPQPGLVFVWTQNDLHVMAATGDARPNVGTVMHNTPYWNVWERGRVCKGNAPFPERVSVDQIDATEAAFFHSRNTHVNVHGKLVRYKGGSTALWRDLLDGKYTSFPDRVLISANLTCARFIALCVGDRYGST